MACAQPERAPRPSRRPLRGLLRMRLSGIGARQNYGRTLGPHPEGPPTAGVSKDGHEGITPIRESLLLTEARQQNSENNPMHSSRLLQFQQLAAKRIALLILRNPFTRRAKQGHDGTIAAHGTEEALVTQ